MNGSAAIGACAMNSEPPQKSQSTPVATPDAFVQASTSFPSLASAMTVVTRLVIVLIKEAGEEIGVSRCGNAIVIDRRATTELTRARPGGSGTKKSSTMCRTVCSRTTTGINHLRQRAVSEQGRSGTEQEQPGISGLRHKGPRPPPPRRSRRLPATSTGSEQAHFTAPREGSGL
jgi:hypothetical protein